MMPGIVRALFGALSIVVATATAALLALPAFSASEIVLAKGGLREPARTIDRVMTGKPACNRGLREVAGCSGRDCKGSISRCFDSLRSYMRYQGCGTHLRRACKITERPRNLGGRACAKGLTEVAGCFGNCRASTSMCFGRPTPAAADTSAIYTAAMGASIAYKPLKGRGSHNYDVRSLRAELEQVFGPLEEAPRIFKDANHDLFVFGAVGDGAILVAWRGSRGANAGPLKPDNSPNWKMNYKAIASPIAPGLKGYWVHAGYGHALPHLYGSIARWLKSRRRVYRNHRVIITGHSLGAAMAGYLTLRLMRDRQVRRGDVFVGFGSPRVGYRQCGTGFNSSAALFADQQRRTGLRAWYAEYAGDPVPKATDASISCPLPLGTRLRFGKTPRHKKNPHGIRNFMYRAAMDLLARGAAPGAAKEYASYGVKWPIPLR